MEMTMISFGLMTIVFAIGLSGWGIAASIDRLTASIYDLTDTYEEHNPMPDEEEDA